MERYCPAILRACALLCLAFAARGVRGSDALPPVERPIHVQSWSGDGPLATPQVEPLTWDTLTYEPRWSGTLGAVLLQRGRLHDSPFLVNPVTGASIINGADFAFPFNGGPDLGLVRYGDWADLEFRYFGVNQWGAQLGPYFSPDGFTIPLQGFNSGGNFPLWMRAWYEASLNSVELNVRRTVLPRWSLLAGFRYISYRERMSGFVGDSTFANGTIITFGTVNDLFGAQLGAEGVLWQPGERFRVETAIKAGLFANAAQSGLWADGRGAGGGGNGRHWFGEDQTAFAGDLSFTGVYQLNEHWALRGGYQLLWLSGVAVAGEQIPRLDLANGDVGTDAAQSVFFHGALMGAEYTW